MLFISPKRKITVLEMSLKSSIMSKLDHQMSKIWKKVSSNFCNLLSKLDRLKNWVAQLSRKKIFCIFTTSYFACLAQVSPLKQQLLGVFFYFFMHLKWSFCLHLFAYWVRCNFMFFSCTQPNQTQTFKPIWTHPKGSQGHQNIRISFL